MKKEQISVCVEIYGNKDVVERILRTLSNITYSCKVGHSANFAIPVDGDGSDKVVVERVDGEKMPKFKPVSRYQTHAEFSDLPE